MYVCLVISMTCIEKKMSNPKLLRKNLELVTYEIGNEKKDQLLTLMQAHWLKSFCNTILLIGSNNQFWNYESWIITTRLTNQIVVDKNKITNIQTRLVKLVLNGQDNCENSNFQFRIWLLDSVNQIQYPILWTNSCAKSCDP